MNKKIYLILIFGVLVMSCKKHDRESPPDILIGNWVCCKIKEHVSYKVVPYPHLNSDYTNIKTPDKTYIINIGPSGMINIYAGEELILKEDIFTDVTGPGAFRIHYYGTRKRGGTQYFDAIQRNDTLIIEDFFPYVAYSKHLGGGHGGSYNFYTYINYFVRQ